MNYNSMHSSVAMNEPAIVAENLTKVYVLDKDRPRTFKEYAGSMLHGRNKSQPKEIMALDDVSFQVNKGEAVGVIGANGSGKSTLLRVLGGITHPISGKATMKGRVASVLDLGTGFHPDMSGLENIYLSGEMLGMKRREIKSKIDEIITFSEIEKFIYNPVKYYSSGMFVRLSFSVIAHLQSDILLLDEVLSVGDAAFQIKSYKKMQELLTSGKAIVLVSHNMGSLSRYTNRCLYLEQGRLAREGPTDEIIPHYVEQLFARTDHNEQVQLACVRQWPDAATAPGNEIVRLHRIAIHNKNRSAGEPIYVDEKIVIEIEFDKLDNTEPINIAIRVNDMNGNPLLLVSPSLDKNDVDWEGYFTLRGKKNLECVLQANLFSSFVFFLDFLVLNQSKSRIIFSFQYLISFETRFKKIDENLITYRLGNYSILPKSNWRKI